MNLFTNKTTRSLLAFATVAMWALPFSLIKVGMAEFGIVSGDIPGETLFAGVRFLAAGICLSLFAKARGYRFKLSGGSTAALVAAFSLVNIFFHYLLFYTGVGVLSGGRASVEYACSPFILIILSCIFFSDDKMTRRKALGCIVGFCGIALVNVDPAHLNGFFANMSIEGDGALLASAACGACGSMLARIVAKHMDSVVATAYSLTIGGALLLVLGLALGGSFGQITPFGLLILAILVFVSAAAFAIYNRLLAENPVSSIAIFNSCTPVLGVIFACFLLGEPFRVEFIAAALLVAAGVALVNTVGNSAK